MLLIVAVLLVVSGVVVVVVGDVVTGRVVSVCHRPHPVVVSMMVVGVGIGGPVVIRRCIDVVEVEIEAKKTFSKKSES